MSEPSQKKELPPMAASTSTSTTKTTSTMSILTIVGAVLGVLGYLIFGMGAARLSYNKFGSIFWALVAFFLAHIYYPYYAFMYSAPSTMMGGMRRRR